MFKTVVRFWWETLGQNVPQAQLRRVPQISRRKVITVVPTGTLCGEGKSESHGALGPNKHLNTCLVMNRPDGILISLSWVTVRLNIGPRLNLAIAPQTCSLLRHSSRRLDCHAGAGGGREKDFWPVMWKKPLTNMWVLPVEERQGDNKTAADPSPVLCAGRGWGSF